MWIELSVHELTRWVGTCIFMGLFRASSLLAHWVEGDSVPDYKAREVMSLYCFPQIKRFIHISYHEQ